MVLIREFNITNSHGAGFVVNGLRFLLLVWVLDVFMVINIELELRAFRCRLQSFTTVRASRALWLICLRHFPISLRINPNP